MLQLNDVSLRRGSLLLFEHAGFQVHAGQRLGVVGANGCGKSSLFAMIQGELEPDAGELRLDVRNRIAHVEQQTASSDDSALNYVIDGDQPLRELQSKVAACEQAGEHDALPELHEQLLAIESHTAEQRAGRLLHGLGFQAVEVNKPVNTFSGGWRMRLNLARALMCRSDILLLDEPTNHLDLPAILWLENWLKRYTGILLLISHDRDFLDAACTHIAHIEHQSIFTSTGNYSAFERIRAERLARQSAMFERQQKEIRHMESFIERFRYKATKARQAQSRLKTLEKMARIAPAHVDSPFHFRIPEPVKQPQHLLKLDMVDAGYTHPVVSQVRCNITAGDRIGLLGANGAGKSTVVKALATGETVLSGGRTVHRDCVIGYFAQHQLEQLEPDASPAQLISRIEPTMGEQQIRNTLGGYGFRGERIFEPVAPLSGGEKARLVLALLIQRRPNLLLLDEPTNHLDLEMRHALSMALAEYSGALIVISHDRHLLRSVCDDFFVVHDGTLEPFGHELERYAEWLRSRDTQVTEGKQGRTASASRKSKRQSEAMRRRRLKPLRDHVSLIDQQIAKARIQYEVMEKRLADESLYTDSARQRELADLVREQGLIRSRIEKLEEDWIEASEALEQADLQP